MSRDRLDEESPPRGRDRGVFRRLGYMAWETIKAFFADNVPQFGAALAFYTTTAVAPLLVLAVAVAQVFFKDGNARRRVLGEIQQLIGPEVSHTVASVQPPAHGPGTATIATVVGLATLVIGALAVFTHLQDALNAIWRAPAHPDETWAAMAKRRLFSLATVVATGFILLVSLTVSAALTWLGENASRWAALPTGVWEAVNFALSLAVITYLFAILFKLLPDVRVRWRDVWTGAFVTALLFVAGKTVLALYIASSNVTSAYGAAGSVVALLLWCYYAAQIVFLGAEFTRVHAWTHGGRTPMADEPIPAPAADTKVKQPPLSRVSRKGSGAERSPPNVARD